MASTKVICPAPLRIITALVTGLFLVLGFSSCNSSNPKDAQPTQPTVSVKVAPNNGAAPVLATLPTVVRDAELQAVSGDPIKISDYDGKVLLVNLWATWCGPCQMETPELVKLHKEFQARGVEMIGLSTENPEASAMAVREFVKDHKIDYRIGWATREVAVTLMQGRDSIPQSFVITRDGHILKRFIGFRAGDDPQATPILLRQALEQALKT